MTDNFPHVRLTPTVAAAPQLLPEHMAAVADAGFTVVINNRPDAEDMQQPSSAEIQAAAEAAGLAYHHFPVNAFNYPGAELATMAALFDNSEAPVLAFCRSGTRSANLWINSRAQDERDAARQRAQQLGFDVSMSMSVS